MLLTAIGRAKSQLIVYKLNLTAFTQALAPIARYEALSVSIDHIPL